MASATVLPAFTQTVVSSSPFSVHQNVHVDILSVSTYTMRQNADETIFSKSQGCLQLNTCIKKNVIKLVSYLFKRRWKTYPHPLFLGNNCSHSCMLLHVVTNVLFDPSPCESCETAKHIHLCFVQIQNVASAHKNLKHGHLQH